MKRSTFAGGTAAAALPAALSAAVLVSAPFAGTTTGPLGGSVAAPQHHSHPHARVAGTQPEALADDGDSSKRSVALTVDAATLMLAGGLFAARRRVRAG